MARGSSAIKVVISGDARDALRAINETEGALGKFGGALKGLAKVGVATAATAAVGIGAALGAGLVDSMNFEAVNDKLAASLGDVDPASIEARGKLASEIYAGAWGDSIEDVSRAIGSVETALGESLGGSEEALKGATTMALDFAEVFDTDVTEAASAASVAISAGLAGDATEAFDLMTASMQKVPEALRGDLTDAVGEYGQFLSGLGIQGEEAFGLLAGAAQDGMYGIDKTGDALKELTIRATDMSAASQTAYAAAGLNAEEMAAKFLAGGDTARGALDELTSGLLAIEDPVERANASIGLFGTPLEDLNTSEIPAFLESLQNMGGELGEVDGAAERMGETLNDNLKTSFESIKRTASVALADVADAALGPAAAAVADMLSDGRITSAIQGLATTVGPMLGQAAEALVQLAPAFTAVTGNAAPFLGILTDLAPVIGQVAEVVGGTFGEALALIAEALAPVVPLLGEVVVSLVEHLGPILEVLVPLIGSFAVAFAEILGGAIELLAPMLIGLVEILGPVLTEVLTTLEPVFPVLAEAITEVFTSLEPLIPSVLKLVESVVPLLPLLAELIATLVEALAPVLPVLTELLVMVLVPALWLVAETVERLASVVGWAAELIVGIVALAVEGIGAYFELLVTAIDLGVEAFGVLPEFLSEIWDDITGTVGDAVDSVTGWFGDLVDAVTRMPGQIASAADGMWDGIVDGFKSAVNFIIRGWNSLEFRIPGFDPPGPGPKFSGFTLGVPDIPQLADGGVVSHRPGGILANIGEGRYDEAVVPLSPQVLGAMGGGGRTVEVTVHVTGNVYAQDLEAIVRRAAQDAVDNELGAAGDQLAVL